MNIFERTFRHLEKRAWLNFAVQGSRAALAPVLGYAAKNPLKMLGGALTASEMAGAGRNAAKVSQGLKNTYQNLEQARQYIGRTF